MNKNITISICLFFSLLCLQCKKDTGVNTSIEKKILLKYGLTRGWSSTKTSIIVFQDKSAIKNINNTEVPVDFSENEIIQLDISLSDFPDYKRIYKPENSIWFDIDTHEIIYYKFFERDTVSIYEPLDSEDIPETLVNLVKLLREK